MKENEVLIGITDCGSYANYEKWILSVPHVRAVRLGYKENNFEDIGKCDGVILSGGEDVHPRLYNRAEYIEFCDEIDERRDEFEWKVLEHTEGKGVPLLGICRGLQMANVYFGGTLIPDIPSFRKLNHSKFPKEDRYHDVAVDPNSLLIRITGQEAGRVNSAHHQSGDVIGNGLIANAFSPDGIIEGMERRDSQGKPYLLLVQWHPERMNPQGSPFTSSIRQSFINAVRSNKE